MTYEDVGTKEDAYAKELGDRYGELIGGGNLRRVLGFSTTAAFKQAVARGTLSLPTFYVPGRKGRFALARDVAQWILACRASAGQPSGQQAPDCFQHVKT